MKLLPYFEGEDLSSLNAAAVLYLNKPHQRNAFDLWTIIIGK